jgi:hypothetical protein
VTEFVLLAIKPFKLEFHLKIFLLVAELAVEVDAMEDILQVPGTISKKLVLLLDGSITLANGVNHTLSLLATIIQLVNMDHAVLQNQLHHAKKLVPKVIQEHTQMINGMLHQFTQFLLLLAKSKLKS